MKRRVVITGYGMITSLGRDTEETFDRASRGMSGIDYIRAFDTRNLPCRIGGQVNDAWLEGRVTGPNGFISSHRGVSG